MLKLTLFDDLCVFVILGVIFGKDRVLIFLDLNKILMTFRLRFTFKDYNFSRDLLTINVNSSISTTFLFFAATRFLRSRPSLFKLKVTTPLPNIKTKIL